MLDAGFLPAQFAAADLAAMREAANASAAILVVNGPDSHRSADHYSVTVRSFCDDEDEETRLE